MSIVLIAIILLLILFIFLMYTKKSDTSKEKVMIHHPIRTLAKELNVSTDNVEYPKINSKSDTCKISNQLGCKLV